MPRLFSFQEIGIVVAFIFSTVLFSLWAEKSFSYPYPPLPDLVLDLSDSFQDVPRSLRPLGGEAGFRDIGALFLGMRRLMSDIAWISVLQYYGEHEDHAEHLDEETHSRQNYPAFEKLVTRVVRLDPFFTYAYLYGGGCLVWNLEQPDQGVKLLEEGMRRFPEEWRFALCLSAIVYKQQGKYDNMIQELEKVVQDAQCPTLLKSILANVYEDRGNTLAAAQLWMSVYENPRTDDWYRQKAVQKIELLTKKLEASPSR